MDYIIMSIAAAKEILEYTEFMEVEYDHECGKNRTLVKLKIDGELPDWYEPLKDKVKREMNK